MKQYILYFLMPFAFISCNNEPKEEQIATQNTNVTDAVSYVVGIGKIVPEKDIIQLSTPVNGIVKKIHKTENDTVDVGSVILELNHELEDQKLVLLRNQLNTQEAQVAVDEANLMEIGTKINNAKSELGRLQNLLKKGAESQQVVDDATANVQALQANLNKLSAMVLLSKSRLQESKSAIRTAQLEQEQKIIRSPIRGKILELDALIGEFISSSQSLGQIEPDGKTIAICEIDEMNAEKVAVGQKGWIRNVGSRDTLSTGAVYFAFSFLKKKSLFTDQAGEKEDRRVRKIKILLDQPENLLLNKRVECVIDVPNSNTN